MNKKLILLGLFFLAVGFSHAVKKIKEVDSLISYAQKFAGTSYGSTQHSTRAFDCSGFTLFVYGNFGYDIGASAEEQRKEGKRVFKNSAKPGDLIFFKAQTGPKKNRRAGHVGIVVENDKKRKVISFLHASNSRGVVLTEYPSLYFSAKLLQVRRVLEKGKKIKIRK